MKPGNIVLKKAEMQDRVVAERDVFVQPSQQWSESDFLFIYNDETLVLEGAGACV